VAVVEALEVRHRRGGRRQTGLGADAQAVAEKKLFVFPIEVENLENLGARLLDDLFARRVRAKRRRLGGAGFQGGEAGIEAAEKRTFLFEERRVWDALLLLQKSVLFQRELIQLIAKC
jgi:hypothetical protein